MSSRLDKKKNQYLKLWERLGIRLRKMLLALFFLTVSVQSITAFDISLLPQNTTIELEGKAVIESYHYEPRGHIKIVTQKKEDISFLKIYINGELKKNINKDYIEFDVRNNAIIEVSGIGNKKGIDIVIEEASDNIIVPKEGTTYRIKDNMVALGRVKLK